MTEYIIDFNDPRFTIEPIEHNGEIVRCRDCKHFTPADKEHGNNDWCAKHEHIGWSYGGFCAWAVKRKEGGDD